MKNLKVNISVETSEERVQDLLTSAFEGGSNYWYTIDKYIYPKGHTKETLNILYQHIELPFKGGTIVISAGGDMPVKRLNMMAIKKGLKTLAVKYPIHFGDFMAGNDDATTGDVFLQCCLYGEIIFG